GGGGGAARFRPKMLGQLLLFFLVMTIAESVAAVPLTFYTTVRMFSLLDPELLLDPNVTEEALTEAMEAVTATIMAENTYFLLSLFSMAVIIVVTVVYCRLIERRPLSSMGLALNARTPLSLLLGLLLGGAMIGGVFLISYATGALTVEAASPHAGLLILYFFAFFVQSSAEEFLFRGYLMPSLSNATTPLGAVLISALFFATMHTANAGFSLLGGINIFIFGVFLGLLVFRTGNLLIACAIHAAWNFACGPVFGMSVSGLAMPDTVLSSVAVAGRELTNGGAFGPEGGIVTTLILTLSMILLLYWPKRQTQDKA
ncbi:MAG: CPBP family intramembrane metalloprotease, partial [Clostridia bacterium]|nr:CPBP family intramembrane metalloprotease [Clostridia bacterium]